MIFAADNHHKIYNKLHTNSTSYINPIYILSLYTTTVVLSLCLMYSSYPLLPWLSYRLSALVTSKFSILMDTLLQFVPLFCKKEVNMKLGYSLFRSAGRVRQPLDYRKFQFQVRWEIELANIIYYKWW